MVRPNKEPRCRLLKILEQQDRTFCIRELNTIHKTVPDMPWGPGNECLTLRSYDYAAGDAHHELALAYIPNHKVGELDNNLS